MGSFKAFIQSFFGGSEFSSPPVGGFLGNTSLDWVGALGLFIVLLLVFWIFQTLVLSRLKRLALKTKTDIDDAFIKIIRSIRPPFYSFLAFYIAFRTLSTPELFSRIIDIVLIIWVVWQVIVAAQILLDFIFSKGIARGKRDAGTKSALKILNNLAKAILWVLGGIFILSNLGINVSSLVAGLGIGGIAIALAMQNILGDLFSSFAIYFDKPFLVGDFVVIGKHRGTVEKIGIKTTRIRAPEGEEVVISNRELTDARIQNFGRIKERRITFSIGVHYNTTNRLLRRLPKMIREIMNSEKGARFERVHFVEFGDSALIFKVTYWIESADYNIYMDINQEVHLKIKKAFENEGVKIAYPTRTIYLEKVDD